MKKDYQLYLFDVDGTLLDSRVLIAESLNAAMVSFGSPAVDSAEIFPLVGQKLEVMFAAYMKELSLTDMDELIATYRAYFDQHLDKLALFPDVIDTLAGLKANGKKISTLTTRPVHNAKMILENLGAGDYFDYYWGSMLDEFHKPQGEIVHKIAKELNVPLSDTVMVGDSSVDFETAANAGIDFIAVSFGTLDRSGWEKLNQDDTRVLDSLKDLL